jgi:hypothetical protein
LFGSFLPSLLVGFQHHQLYSGIGADIVMESFTLKTSAWRIQFLKFPLSGRWDPSEKGHPAGDKPKLEEFTAMLNAFCQLSPSPIWPAVLLRSEHGLLLKSLVL